FLKGDSERYFLKHLRERLLDHGCRILERHRVTGIGIDRGAGGPGVRVVRIISTRSAPHEPRDCSIGLSTRRLDVDVTTSPSVAAGLLNVEFQEFDYVVLAIPPEGLSRLTIERLDLGSDPAMESAIVQIKRELFPVASRLKTQSMASLDLCFN